MFIAQDQLICSVKLMDIYLFMRGGLVGPLFINLRGPTTRQKVDNLGTFSQAWGWNRDHIQTHSLGQAEPQLGLRTVFQPSK